MSFVLPKVYFIGFTEIDNEGIDSYLSDTGQESFLEEMNEAAKAGISSGEILCSFYAKSCYASLTDKKNKNISKVRSIPDNIASTISSGHGSVFEHCSLNFMVTNCSRVFTHEMVRHRVGTAFSQTSGRYVRTDELNIVFDPILDPIKADCELFRFMYEEAYKAMEKRMLDGVTDFAQKKKITSALRRFLPNGQANEIGVTLNLRTLRHTIETRTSRHAEWEIRNIFAQIARLVCDKYPLIFADSMWSEVDGEMEIMFQNKKI